MIYVFIPPRSGKMADMQKLMAAVEQLAEAMRQAFEPTSLAMPEIDESGEDDSTEAEDKQQCIVELRAPLLSLPIHLIPWYTSGFQ